MTATPVPAASAVTFKIFRGTLATWKELFIQASGFASTLGKERLITISHSADSGDGVVVVWYWN